MSMPTQEGKVRLTDDEIAAQLSALVAAHRGTLAGTGGYVERARAALVLLGWAGPDALATNRDRKALASLGQ